MKSEEKIRAIAERLFELYVEIIPDKTLADCPAAVNASDNQENQE